MIELALDMAERPANAALAKGEATADGDEGLDRHAPQFRDLRALQTPAMKERLATLGAEAIPNTPKAFAAFVKAQRAKYREIVRASGAKAD